VAPRSLLAAAVAGALAGLVYARLAVEQPPMARSLRIEALWVEAEAIPPGATVTRETVWTPEGGVTIVGWNPWVRVPPGSPLSAELVLFEQESRTALFDWKEDLSDAGEATATASFGEGQGFRIARGRRLALRVRLANRGAEPVFTRTAGALVYSVAGD
jgi:hypothetical protein